MTHGRIITSTLNVCILENLKSLIRKFCSATQTNLINFCIKLLSIKTFYRGTIFPSHQCRKTRAKYFFPSCVKNIEKFINFITYIHLLLPIFLKILYIYNIHIYLGGLHVMKRNLVVLHLNGQ